MLFYLVLAGFAWPCTNAAGSLEVSKKLEAELLAGYNNRHRPVKKEQTAVQVSVYISVTHVEKVDEREQTMLVHGHLWATWFDEYLQWSPSKYNNTDKLTLDAWKIWQPALALYNSARGNAWHLYMNGMPALVGSTGKVWASGAFSFHVTCRFDFTNWPYDEQECPIVISDWVYDLSRVNLSDPNDNPWNKPTIRLNYDPVKGNDKKHVAGWEVYDTWRRHCYWGPNGCREEQPEGQPEWYWSLLEFGVKLKRHAPYVALTVLLPSVVTTLLTLVAFWVDTWTTSCSLLIFNILLQGLFGWDLIRELPPGSGGVPRIVTLYGLNLVLTTAAFVIHVILNYLQAILPTDMQLPSEISSFPSKIRLGRLFETKGLSFDPQTFLNSEEQTEEEKEYHSPLASIRSSSALEEEQGRQEHEEDTSNLIAIEEQPTRSEEPKTNNGGLSLETIEEGTREEEKQIAVGDLSGTEKQLYFVRRLIFCLYIIIYVIVLPYGIL